MPLQSVEVWSAMPTCAHVGISHHGCDGCSVGTRVEVWHQESMDEKRRTGQGLCGVSAAGRVGSVLQDLAQELFGARLAGLGVAEEVHF